MAEVALEVEKPEAVIEVKDVVVSAEEAMKDQQEGVTLILKGVPALTFKEVEAEEVEAEECIMTTLK